MPPTKTLGYRLSWLAGKNKIMPHLRKETRSELRRERYNYLRRIGFSPVEARRRRDTSADNIRGFVSDERKRIVAISSKKRSENDRKIIRNIRVDRRRENRIETAPRLRPMSQRVTEFSKWSGEQNFPSWAETFIAQQNLDRGLDPFDSYGFRRFYWRYVEGLPTDEIGDLADRGDSDINAVA